MTKELYPYQREGVEILSKNRYFLLADEMGLGKTAQCIKSLEKYGLKRILVICPTVAKINWEREFEMWSEDHSKYNIEIMDKLSDEALPGTSVICSYNYATENFDKLREHGFDQIILDECHFLKSVDAKRAKSILGARGIIRGVKGCWWLSGTPAPNNASELWIILYTLSVTKMTYDQFITHFCITQKTSYSIKILGTKPEALNELRKLLSKIMLRRTKKEVMTELPPISFEFVRCEPGHVDPEEYDDFQTWYWPVDRRRELTEKLAEEAKLLKTVFNPLSDSQKLLPALGAIGDSVSTLRRYIGLQKIQATVEMVSRELEANAYDKIVIFALHRDVIETLRKKFRKYGVVTVYGGTPLKKRQKHVDAFQNKVKPRVFIGNVLAAGTAINLTKAHQVLMVEQDWVPGNNAQAVMRCHRIGQTMPVQVRILSIHGTIDQRINHVLKKKMEDLTEIFNPFTVDEDQFEEQN